MASMTPDPVLPGTDVGSVVGPDILGDSALGDVTLAQPAHHRSGLPRLPLSPAIVAGSFASRLGAHDPYPDWSASRLLREAADTSAGEKKFAYSNLGGAVAGHTLAIAADEKYPTLMQDRIFGPIGMDHTIVATSWEDLPDGRVTGSDSQGRTQSPWVSPGFAPAGIGTWSTAEDLGILLASILDGNAPGLEATRPEVSIDSEGAYAIGKFWLTSEHNGQTITWHNGGTDGFRSWMGFDRDAGTGVAILSAGHRDLEDLGLYLLGAGEAPDDQGWALPGWLGIGVVILLTLGVWRIWRAALRARQGKGTDLVGVAGLGIESLIILTIGWVLGPWTTLPWTVWSAIAAATLVGLGGLIWWNRDAKWFHGSKWRALNTVVNLGLAAVVVVLIL